ncbi:Phosphonoacetaldehyde hydrolase, partial [human gut metagenome]
IDVTMEEARIPMGMLKRDHIKTMMDVVTKGAKEKGYAPDFYVTPDSTNSNGRPYPYMIYRNMEALKLSISSSLCNLPYFSFHKSDILFISIIVFIW